MSPDDPRLSDPAWLAGAATGPHSFFRGEYGVPGVTWIRDGQPDFPGRLGRPAVRMIPVSWLPQKLGDEVRRQIALAIVVRP